jgi:hypothetical protein
MPSIEIDDVTLRALEFAARMARVSPGDIVARLVDQASLSAGTEVGSQPNPADPRFPIYADYDGYRTQAKYDRSTGRVDIVGGPLDGQSFKTPTGAARAVVSHYKPEVSPHRNGWTFWSIDDRSGRTLQSVRH